MEPPEIWSTNLDAEGLKWLSPAEIPLQVVLLRRNIFPPTVAFMSSRVKRIPVTKSMLAKVRTFPNALMTTLLQSNVHYASAQHVKRGHEIVPADCLIPYRSNSLSHRLIIETCLLSVSNTVKGNKASSCNKDMTTIAPIILQASPVDWKIIAEAQPDLNPVMVPRKYRQFFLVLIEL